MERYHYNKIINRNLKKILISCFINNIINIYIYFAGDKSIKLPLLIYATHAATTTLACIAELMFGDNKGLERSQKNFLLIFDLL